MSTAMTSPAGRRRATMRTATPVTNIASVDSMNGAPEDRPDADAVRRLRAAAEEDRDDRDHRLRERRADGREDRADRALGELELPAEPLDAVREQLGAEQDDEERDDEDEDVHRIRPRRPGASTTLSGDDRQDQRRHDAPSSVRPAGRSR